MAKKYTVRHAALDFIWRVLMMGATLLTIATAFLSMYPPSPLAPLFHNPDPKAQADSVLYFAIVGSISLLVYSAIAIVIYRAVKRSFTRRDLASGREFDDKAIQQTEAAPALRDRKKAVTIPNEEFDKEVAWLFQTIYPVHAKVDTSGKGKINIKLYNGKNALVGVAQASQDAVDKYIRPDALKSLNSYKSKANLPRAFFVSTGKFTGDTLEQAKAMGITLIDGQLLDDWRKRAKTKAPQQKAPMATQH